MQREVTVLNKSNKLVSAKWLARIAFPVGQCSRTCSTVSWVWHALHWGGLSLFRRYPCVKKVCPIRSRWMIISSQRGNRNDLVMFTVGSYRHYVYRQSSSKKSFILSFISRRCSITLPFYSGLEAFYIVFGHVNIIQFYYYYYYY